MALIKDSCAKTQNCNTCSSSTSSAIAIIPGTADLASVLHCPMTSERAHKRAIVCNPFKVKELS